MTAMIVHQEPLEIGGHTVISMVEIGYYGPCAVKEYSSDEIICAFPTYDEAERSARYAVKPDGGYGSVTIVPCSADEITHAEFVDWAFKY